MKFPILLTFFCFASICKGQEAFKPIEAKIYHWADAPVSKKENMEQRPLLEGSSVAFKHIKIHATTVYPHQSPRNNIWQAKNQWFSREVLPELKSIVHTVLNSHKAL